MSGLETAIRNALDRAERGDGQVRARIYQSARQALDAGLRKQGVTDTLVIMQQRKRLEEKIQEIENEEIDRLAQMAARPPGSSPGMIDTPHAEMPVPPYPPRETAAMDMERSAQASNDLPPDGGALGGVTRADPVLVNAGAAPSLDASPRSSVQGAGMEVPALPVAEKPKGRKSKARTDKAKGSMAGERAAKPRRRRGFLSHLMTWLVTLGVVAVGCWIFYRSGTVQAIIEDAVRAAGRPSASQSAGQGPSVISSRGGFSEEWAPIFDPKDGAAFQPGAQAQAQIATGSEGQALKLESASAASGGDVAIEVPVEILRELSGKSSTLAITIQSAINQPSQLSVRCDFGSLGTCSRHRFTATQEKQDALFRVSFEGTLAPNTPGRLIVNSALGGAARPVFIYSIRALPGQ